MVLHSQIQATCLCVWAEHTWSRLLRVLPAGEGCSEFN